jgi:hypothetical protein
MVVYPLFQMGCGFDASAKKNTGCMSPEQVNKWNKPAMDAPDPPVCGVSSRQ